MSPTSPGTQVAPRRTLTPQFAVAAGGLVGATGGATYISSFVLLSELSGRDAVRSPLCVTANVLMTIGFVMIALALPSLATPPRQPRWITVTVALGCAFLASTAWAMATLGADVAATVTDTQWDNPGMAAFLGLVPKTLLCAVGFLALAVTGWRQRAFSRGACILLALTALAALLPPHPPAALLGGLALTWAARSQPRTNPS